ncbi:MAG: histidine kinase, partial [Oscillospiraceae bacterium]
MKKVKLKNIITWTWVSSILIILILQFVCIVIVFNQIESERTSKINDYVISTKTIITENIKKIDKIQKALLSSVNLQETLKHSNENTFLLLDDILKLRAFSSDNFHLVLFDSSQSLAFMTDNLQAGIYASITDFYKEYQNSGTDLFFCKPNDSVLSEIYLISFHQVNVPSTKTATLDNLGTSIVINKINTIELSNILTNDPNLEIHLENPSYDDVYITKHYPNNKRPSIKTVELENSKWSLVGKYVYQTDSSPIFSIRWLIIIEPLLVLLILLLLQFIYKIYIDKSIKEISTFLNQYLILKKGTSINEQRSFEFDNIATNINNMIDKNEKLSRKIAENQRNLYEREIEKKTTILYALQSQINPHFLYNTLDCIKSIAFVKQIPEIVDIAVSFSHIIRYSLKETQTVTVENEIDLLNKY